MLAGDMASADPKVRDLLGDAESHGVPKLSVGVAWDTRDDETSPTRGLYITEEFYVTPRTFGAVDYQFARLDTAVHVFVPIIPHERRLVFAARVVNDLLFGDPPFYELPRFQETFEAVREHFREIFRRLFGGGRAEVLLEDPNDLLGSGIEIVARPPGKEQRTISLLSGGEKTLTAVALLFAVFRAKPSPFAILDEVDAALDEANIRRLVSLVAEFTAGTQFLVVTHAKTTMESANLLYGVTMEEPGVSKKVGVRLGDSSPEPEREAVAATA